MQTDIREKKPKHGRQFSINDKYDIESLANELAQWLKTEHEKETACLKIEKGWLVQARGPGGTLIGIVRRKAGAMHVSMVREDNSLDVRIAHDKSADKEDKERASVSFLEATTDLAGAAASGIAEVWTEAKTTEAVLDFIGRHIADYSQQESAIKTSATDAYLSRYVESVTKTEQVWLAGFLKSDLKFKSDLKSGEILLAWLKTSTKAPDSDTELIFILTTHRSVLASFSKTGAEKSLRELPTGPVSVTDTVGRETVTAGDVTWRTQLHNDMLFREIAPLLNLDPVARLHESARLNFISRDKQGNNLKYAMSILSHISELSDNPLNALTRFYLELVYEKKKNQKNIFADMAENPNFSALAKELAVANPEHLSLWADFWQLNTVEQLTLAELIQAAVPGSQECAGFVSPMLAKATARFKKETKDKTLHILPDIQYAENLILCGQCQEAVRILEHRLSELPDESLCDLLPAKDSDLTKGQGGQVIKTRILELLAEGRGIHGKEDADTLTTLALLYPLVSDRLKRLYDIAGKDVRKRVSVPIGLLEKGGLISGKGEERIFQGKASPLVPGDIETKLRHPASREGTLIKKLQNFIALKKAPDHSSLKSYAKRVNIDDHPELASSIMDGSIILGMVPVEAFISFGDQNMGIVGYGGKSPFILIGNMHLESGTEFSMNPLELRFITGVELAHLRFGHERITSGAVWRGAFDKTMSLIELFPVAGYLGKLGKYGKLAGHTVEMARKVGGVQQYITQTRDAGPQNLYHKHIDTDKTSETVADANEKNLITTFREMQLTADRAALVICGDLKAAVRAVFKSCPRLNPELSAAERYGLADFLSRTNEKGELIFQDLAIRLAALFSFYLSEDYKRLRAVAVGAAGDGQQTVGSKEQG